MVVEVICYEVNWCATAGRMPVADQRAGDEVRRDLGLIVVVTAVEARPEEAAPEAVARLEEVAHPVAVDGP